jgi:hypothetical protein
MNAPYEPPPASLGAYAVAEAPRPTPSPTLVGDSFFSELDGLGDVVSKPPQKFSP